MTRSPRFGAVLGLLGAMAACNPSGTTHTPPIDPCRDAGQCPVVFRINEIMASNDGAWIDEAGEADDWLEIVNVSDAPASLLGYTIGDGAVSHFLPGLELQPGAVSLLWADDDLDQGLEHLAFEIRAGGETITITGPRGDVQDRVVVPASEPNRAYARFPDGDDDVVGCIWSTPGRPNGATCGPPPPVEPPVDHQFPPYAWPDPFPALAEPLALTELALRPAQFIEVVNTSDGPVDLTAFSLTVAPHRPGVPWPALGDGATLPWPAASIDGGAALVIPVDAGAVAALEADPHFEGVVTLWSGSTPLERVDFMAWPSDAALARDDDGTWRMCTTTTPGAPNDRCDPLASRPVGDRLRNLYTPGDFAALAEGSGAVGIEAVKVVVDMDAGDATGDVVHLLSSAAWDLHYTFIRERIDGEAPLDRCDPDDAALFMAGWSQFSQEQYFVTEGRRYLLGTLTHHQGNDLRTLEFVTGDMISASQMRRAFFGAAAAIDGPTQWSLRPQGPIQLEQMISIEGTVPIVDGDAPLRDLSLQLLAEGVAYGVLTFVPTEQLYAQALGPQVIVVTDLVPGDIPLVGGLITESLQTPLAHVNVLSRNRGTPNMALRDARDDPRVAPLLDTLVRLEVRPSGFTLAAADPVEAQAFWEARNQSGPALVPRLDTSVRGIVPLLGRGLEDMPSLGAKAAQLAEIARVISPYAACTGPVTTPRAAAAVAVVHSIEHYEASGAAARLAELEADPTFASDPRYRAEQLRALQALIKAHPVDPELLDDLYTYVATNFGSKRVRLRSSSNTEDLPGFNGAGLYTSVSAELGDPDRTLEDGLRAVWASLYNPRAYDERLYSNIDGSAVAMGVMIHGGFSSEEANVVAISRNIDDPVRGDIYSFNAQAGEASVVSPAPGITTEQLHYRFGRTPRVVYQAHSNLPGGEEVLAEHEVERIACQLRAIHRHFQPLIDPNGENRWFAIDAEVKLADDTREVVFKQARPYSFGDVEVPADCREF